MRETDTRSEAEILEIHGMGKTSTRLEAGFLGIHGAGKASTRSEGMILGEASDPEDKYYGRGEDKGKTSAMSEADAKSRPCLP